MTVEEVVADKKLFLPLLLLGDEQEDMIDCYLNLCRMFVMKDGDEAIGVCAVQDMGDGLLEIKNLAIAAQRQRSGLGRMLIDYVAEKYRATHTHMQVGTGDSPLTLPFYERCGFVRSHVVKNFFLDNYDHEIIEDGVRLIDMIYLCKQLH